jgi:hypothetical protein
MFNGGRGGQNSKRLKHFRAMLHIAAGQFPHDKWVTHNLVFIQQSAKSGGVGTKVIDPHRSIDQYGHD